MIRALRLYSCEPGAGRTATAFARAARWLAPIALLASGVLGSRADAAEFAAPAAVATGSAAGGTLRMMLALLIVVATVFAAGWLMRRLRQFQTGRGADLEVLSQVSLGTRERAVWLRAGAQHLLLGVAAGQVRLLMELPSAPAAAESAASTAEPGDATLRPSFKQLLLRSLGK